MGNPRDIQCKSLVMGLHNQANSGALRVSLQVSHVCLFCCLQDGREHCTCAVCWGQTWDSIALDLSKSLTWPWFRGKKKWLESFCKQYRPAAMCPDRLITPYHLSDGIWAHVFPATCASFPFRSVNKVCTSISMNSLSCFLSIRSWMGVSVSFPKEKNAVSVSKWPIEENQKCTATWHQVTLGWERFGRGKQCDKELIRCRSSWGCLKSWA